MRRFAPAPRYDRLLANKKQRARQRRPKGVQAMITQRQIDFRNEYRLRIVGWDNGYFHVVLIYAMVAAVFYIYVSHLHSVTWLEWLTVPLTFIFTNIFEWTVHKYVMHRPVNIKGLRGIYEGHTLNNHKSFMNEKCC